MTFPNDLDISNLSREQIINILLASIGFEELALADLVKSQAELLRLAMGKPPVNCNGKVSPMINSLEDLLRINCSVNKTMKTIKNKESILLAKLKEVVKLIEEAPISENGCAVSVQTGEAVIEAAYINENAIRRGLKVDKIDISLAEKCALNDNKIILRFSDDTCQVISITLVGNTATVLCNQAFDTALIRAVVQLNTAVDEYNGIYQAFISVRENGILTIFLENGTNRILFSITGAEARVDECPGDGQTENLCQCSLSVATNQNTTITLTGDNVFSPATITGFDIDVPCNCNAADSSISLLIREDFIQIFLPGEFIEGTLSTICTGNEATFQGSATIGDVLYQVSVQANQNGTATAIFEGATGSAFTLTLTGAAVAISGCTSGL